MGGALSTSNKKVKGPNSPDSSSSTPKTPVDDEKLKEELRKKVVQMLDPRSPTVEIVRTPITLEEEKENAARRLKMMHENLDKTPTGPPGDKVAPFYRPSGLAFDPRSPAQEFKRTPIQLQFQPKNT